MIAYSRFKDIFDDKIFAESYSGRKGWNCPLILENYIQELRHILLTNNAAELPEASKHPNSCDSVSR